MTRELDSSASLQTVGSAVTAQDKIDIANQVWNNLRANHTGPGSFGQGVNLEPATKAQVDNIESTVTGLFDFNPNVTPVELRASAGGAAGKSSEEVVTDIWAALTGPNTATGSMGERLVNGVSSFDPASSSVELRATGGVAGRNASELVTDTWAAATAANKTPGSFGEKLGNASVFDPAASPVYISSATGPAGDSTPDLVGAFWGATGTNWTGTESMGGRTNWTYNTQAGRWRIVANQLILYQPDNTTEMARFDLFDAFGDPTTTGEVFDRQRT